MTGRTASEPHLIGAIPSLEDEKHATIAVEDDEMVAPVMPAMGRLRTESARFSVRKDSVLEDTGFIADYATSVRKRVNSATIFPGSKVPRRGVQDGESMCPCCASPSTHTYSHTRGDSMSLL